MTAGITGIARLLVCGGRDVVRDREAVGRAADRLRERGLWVMLAGEGDLCDALREDGAHVEEPDEEQPTHAVVFGDAQRAAGLRGAGVAVWEVRT